MTSVGCSVFSYTSGVTIQYYYKDIFEAEANCNTCTTGSGYIKITTSYTICALSAKCATFGAGPYLTLAAAELECATC